MKNKFDGKAAKLIIYAFYFILIIGTHIENLAYLFIKKI